MSTDSPKINIVLTPYQALSIMKFLSEFEEINYLKELEGLKESVDEYNRQINLRITIEQIDDALAELSVNQLLGKDPKHD